MIFPVITLHQPWATWIMRGWKTIETRTHERFGGLMGQLILIHAGKKVDDSVVVVRNPYLTVEQLIYKPDEVINGYILGIAYVWDFRKLDGSHSKRALIDCFRIQRYGLFLSFITKYENPIPVNGSQGIWYFDTDTKQKVKKPRRDLSQSKIFTNEQS